MNNRKITTRTDYNVRCFICQHGYPHIIMKWSGWMNRHPLCPDCDCKLKKDGGVIFEQVLLSRFL